MEITLITGSKLRHLYFINLLRTVSRKLNVIQETPKRTNKNIPIKKYQGRNVKIYFNKLRLIEKKIFKIKKNIYSNNKIKIYSIASKTLSSNKLNFLNDFKNTNLFILYGCRHIKNNLFHYLNKKKTICIHMGVLPYYKGADCNFWALYDENTHLVGSTIMKISKNFEEGKILYYAFPHYAKNPFEYSMLASKAAFVSVVEKIKNRSIFKIKSFKQDKRLQIRETKKIQFNERIVKKFFLSSINTKNKKEIAINNKNSFFLRK
mgnify:CR=1 FL=1